MGHSMFDFSFALDELEERALRIFDARLKERGVTAAEGYAFKVIRTSRCGEEDFHISGLPGASELSLDCGSPAAFLYAVGKILRTGRFEEGKFYPGNWRGVWSPAKKVRCVYWANHFFNVYHVSPLRDLDRYLEDLALWGFNCLALTCDPHVMKAFSQEYHQTLEKNKQIWLLGQKLGMKPIDLIDNGSFEDTPEHLRAVPTGRSFFGTELCPSNPESLDYIINLLSDRYEYLKEVNFGMVIIWSYDQGGCGCPECSPYGAKGMCIWGEKAVAVIRKKWPECRIIWSTWLMDWVGVPMVHEFENLYRKINNKEAEYIDYLLADSHDEFPEYVLSHPLPGKTGLLTFPEISMYGRSPWGGFGATPLPKRFSALWGETAGLADGGVLYSEGIFEDFNKVLYANFFSSGSNDVSMTVREYCRYEFGMPEALDKDFDRFLDILEENHAGLQWWPGKPSYGLYEPMKTKIAWRQIGKTWKDLDEELALARKIDANLPEWARKSWRWRLFYLRAVIDYEIGTHDNEATAVSEEAMKELCVMYRIDLRKATRRVSPFTDEYLAYHAEENAHINLAGAAGGKNLGVI